MSENLELIVGAADYLCAEAVLHHFYRNREIEFKIDGEAWDRERTEAYLKDCEAMLRVRKMLIDRAEEIGIPKR